MSETRARLLDLFCGAGGAAMGYHQAGFDEIVGVDIVPQPNYPFEFIQYDLSNPDLEFDLDLFAFDLIHASPPCQIHSSLKHVQQSDYADRHQDLVAWTRDVLIRSGVPYVIENVPGAPLVDPVRFCGTSFGATIDAMGVRWEMRRHRIFETSWTLWAPPKCNHQWRVLGIYGDLGDRMRPNNPKRRAAYGPDGLPANDWKAGFDQAQKLMGIDWMDRAELVQAIPPAYTRYIGEAFLTQQLGADDE